jgi:hypothetical protein
MLVDNPQFLNKGKTKTSAPEKTARQKAGGWAERSVPVILHEASVGERSVSAISLQWRHVGMPRFAYEGGNSVKHPRFVLSKQNHSIRLLLYKSSDGSLSFPRLPEESG